jgi:N-methylhydantoinase A
VQDAFHARHEQLFTYALRGEEVVLVNARLAVVGRLPSLGAGGVEAAQKGAAPRPRRRILMEGQDWQEVPVHGFAELAGGDAVAGPAIVESETTTILLLPGDRARMDGRGWLDISLPEPA